MEASFGCYRDEIGHDDKHEGGRCDRCHRSVDLAVLKPRWRNEKDGARRDLTTVTMDDVLSRAPGNWYFEGNEAKSLGLVSEVL